MAVNKVPVLKRCRSLGLEPMYLGVDKKSKRELKRANKKMSEYGLQLREKQKAKFIYGVMEVPFRNYFEKAKKMNGMAGENLMQLLECRLDNVIFRLGYARTRRESRQIVGHRWVQVNGKTVNIASYLVKAGDKIEIKERDGKLVWVCPQCGNDNQDKMNVARRTCGYIGTQFWNQGRTQEIRERVMHL